eukprot:gene6720-biopygen10946
MLSQPGLARRRCAERPYLCTVRSTLAMNIGGLADIPMDPVRNASTIRKHAAGPGTSHAAFAHCKEERDGDASNDAGVGAARVPSHPAARHAR